MSTLADLPELIGFFSYSREDDDGSNGALPALRDAIQGELSAQLGRSPANFLVWQDKTTISDGTLWENQISGAINQTVFFIPIVSPRALRSQHCIFEFESFLSREAMLGREDLVFPILYIPVPELEDEKQWRQDPVLKIVGKRQYLDLRDLRPRGLYEPEVQTKIIQFCRNIAIALRKPWVTLEERTAVEIETDRRNKRRAEQEQAFAAAKSADTVTAIDAFIASFPDSHLAGDAQSAKARLLARYEAHGRAMASDDPVVLESFLYPYPNGPHADGIRERLRKLQLKAEDEKRRADAPQHAEEQAFAAAKSAKARLLARDDAHGPAMVSDNTRAEQEKLAKTKSRFLSDWRIRRPGSNGLLARVFAPTDVVDCTVFAPRMVRPEAWMSVQIFLHAPEGRTQAEKLATAMDANTAMRGISTLEVELNRGARVQIQLDVPNAKIDEPVQTLVWQGHTQGRSFRVSLPTAGAGQEFNAKARFFLEGVPIGWVGFVLACGTNDDGEELVAQGRNARRYMRAFISYASEDRPEVKKRIQALRALKIEFFHDILSLDPGERWERRLYDEIDRCDLFMLFWSRAAGRSEWVGKEIARAMERRRSSTEETPDIAPIALEAFSVAPLPAALSEFHFDSSTM
jgi:hypothetical protein